MENAVNLCQHFTPVWMAEALVERHFSWLRKGDNVLEPTCGPGAFLAALPAEVDAFGIEIEWDLAAHTTATTGRKVYVGDVLDPLFARLRGIQAVIGNPPFQRDFIDQLLERCYHWLTPGGQAGLILPAYAFRTAQRVVDLAERWSITQEMLPRSAFAYRMREPLVFAVFTKDRARRLIGFALYQQEADRQGMRQAYRALLARSKGSAWRAVCRLALERLGATEAKPAPLAAIYAELEGNRPSRTTWWREKIRQTLRQYPDFRAIEEGQYAIAV